MPGRFRRISALESRIVFDLEKDTVIMSFGNNEIRITVDGEKRTITPGRVLEFNDCAVDILVRELNKDPSIVDNLMSMSLRDFDVIIERDDVSIECSWVFDAADEKSPFVAIIGKEQQTIVDTATGYHVMYMSGIYTTFRNRPSILNLFEGTDSYERRAKFMLAICDRLNEDHGLVDKIMSMSADEIIELAGMKDESSCNAVSKLSGAVSKITITTVSGQTVEITSGKDETVVDMSA